MRKSVFFFLLIPALLLSSFQPTLQAAAATNTIHLDQFYFVPGKGWVVVFGISGDWKPADLKGGFLTVSGNYFALYCKLRDGSHISCTTGSLAPFVGQTASIYFAGQAFYAVIPEKRGRGSGFAECPSGTQENLDMFAIDGIGIPFYSIESYPAEMYTIQQGAAQWLSGLNTPYGIALYIIRNVTCTPIAPS